MHFSLVLGLRKVRKAKVFDLERQIELWKIKFETVQTWPY